MIKTFVIFWDNPNSSANTDHNLPTLLYVCVLPPDWRKSISYFSVLRGSALSMGSFGNKFSPLFGCRVTRLKSSEQNQQAFAAFLQPLCIRRHFGGQCECTNRLAYVLADLQRKIQIFPIRFMSADNGSCPHIVVTWIFPKYYLFLLRIVFCTLFEIEQFHLLCVSLGNL